MVSRFLLPPYRQIHIIIFGSITLALWTAFLVWTVILPSLTPHRSTTSAQDQGSIEVQAIEGEAETFSSTPSAQPIHVPPTPTPTLNPNRACRVLETGAAAVVSIIGQDKDVAPIADLPIPAGGDTETCVLTNRIASTDQKEQAATELAGLMMTTFTNKAAATAAFDRLKSANTNTTVEVVGLPAVYDTTTFVVIVQKEAIVYQFYAGQLPPSSKSQELSVKLATICLMDQSVLYLTPEADK